MVAYKTAWKWLVACVFLITLPVYGASFSSTPTRSQMADGTFDLTWSTGAGEMAPYYLYQKNSSGSETLIYQGSSKTYTVSGVTEGTYTYTLWVHKMSFINPMEPDLVLTKGPTLTLTVDRLVVPPKMSTPSAPTTDSDRTFTISWSASTGEDVTKYQLQGRISTTSTWSSLYNGASRSKTYTAPSDGTFYFRVRAYNDRGWGSFSNTDSTIVAKKPGTPSSLTVPGTDYDGNVTISWGTASGTVDKYQLQQQTNGGSWSTVYQGTAKSKALTLGTGSYKFRVRACNVEANFNSCSGFRTSGTLKVVLTPSVPQINSIPSGNVTDSFSIGWTASSNVTRYELQHSPNNSTWTTIYSGTSRSQTVSYSDGQHYFRVRACHVYSGVTRCSGYGSTKTVTVVLPSWAAKNGSISAGSFTNVTMSASDNQLLPLKSGGGVSGGAASYSIPIIVPPGRNGVQPSISLSYSSKQGSGIAGVGWSMNAAGAIARCPATIAQDGYSGAVTFNYQSDKLCLNGERLILTSGTYGYANAEYRTEMDSFVSVKQYTSHIDNASTYFVVTHKNGAQAYYGNSANSRKILHGHSKPFQWLLSSTTDASANNSVYYEYVSFGKAEMLLSQICYSDSCATTNVRRVEFEYEASGKPRTTYVQGGAQRSTQILDKITTFVGTSRVVEYDLTYQYSAANGQPLLAEVKACDANNYSQCFAPVSMEWDDNPLTYELEKLDFGNSQSPDIMKSQPYADINRDGVRDWPSANGGTTFVDAEGTVTGTAGYQLDSCYQASWQVTTCLYGDFNRDGRTDSWRKTSNTIQVALTNESTGRGGWINTGISVPNSSYVTDANVKDINDYNGDAWPDLAVMHNNGDIKLYFHTTNPSAPYTVGNSVHVASLAKETPTTITYLTETVSFPGDMDGNGLPDIVFSTSYDSARETALPVPIPKTVYYSHSNNGAYTKTSGSLPNPYSGENFYYFTMFFDINSDGLPDLLAWDTSNTNPELVVYINKGASSWSSKIDLSIGQALAFTSQNYLNKAQEPEPMFSPRYLSSLRVMDIDADGKAELLVPKTNIAKGCRPFNDSGSWQTKCGNDLYGTYAQSQLEAHALGAMPASQLDDGLYTFEAITFEEHTDGTFTASIINTPFIGSATQTTVVDSRGKGLNDFIFSYGPRIDANTCTIPNGCIIQSINSGYDMSGYNGDHGVYGYINYGAGSANNDGSGYAPVNMLRGVTNATGVSYRWEYLPLTSSQMDSTLASMGVDAFYQRNNTKPSGAYLYFASSMYNVARMEVTNGVGSVNDTYYAYENAVYNTEGRGFQGFTTIHTLDVANNVRSEAAFNVTFPLTGRIKNVTDYVIGHGLPIKFQENEWARNTAHQSLFGSEVYHYYLKKSTAKQYHVHTHAVSSTLATTVKNEVTGITAYGNVSASYKLTSSEFGQYKVSQSVAWAETSACQNRFNSKQTTYAKVTGRASNDPYTSGDYDKQRTATQTVTSWNDTHCKPNTITSTGTDVEYGQTVTTAFNSYGLPSSITTSGAVRSNSAWQNQSRTVSFTYTENGTTAANNGYFVLTTNNGKWTEESQYSPAFGQVTRHKDGNNVYQYTQYTGLGLVDYTYTQSGSTTLPRTYTRHYEPDSDAPSHAVVMTITRTAGMPDSKVYTDQLGREVKSSMAGFAAGDWYSTVTEYDERGRKTFVSQPFKNNGNQYGERFEYNDILGRATERSVDQPLNNDLFVTYDYNGFTTNITAGGLVMSRTHGPGGLLMSTEDALGGVTRYSYTSAGWPIIIQDAANAKIFATMDALGNKLKVEDPNQGVTEFEYNAFGELALQKDANNDIVTFEYDTLGRILTRRTTDSSYTNSTATWTWDTLKKGLLTQEVEHGATRSYTYDSFARPQTVTVAIDSSSLTKTHFYDAYGRPQGLAYPNGLVVKYDYNAQGYLTHEKNANSGYVYRQVTAMDAFGNITGATLTDSVGVNYTAAYYQQNGSMMHVIASKGSHLHYLEYSDFDNFGNLKTVSDHVNNTVETYGYDDLQRLTGNTVKWNGTTVQNNTYQYNATGNLLKKSDYANTYRYGDATKSLGGNAGPSAVRQVVKLNNTTVNFSYDAKGNLLSGDGLTTQYTVHNKPRTLSRSGNQYTFTYGADTSRVKQVKSEGGVSTTTYYLDKDYEADSSGHWRAYIGDVALISYDGDTKHTINFGHRDRLGSATTFTDHNGAITNRRGYDPFGRPRGSTGSTLTPSTQTTGDQSATSNFDKRDKRGFTGHEHVDGAQVIHMNGRVYDYNLGRFMSVDPFVHGGSQGINPYSYIMNNPLAGTDPSGYEPEVATKEMMIAATGSNVKHKVTATVTQNEDGSATVTFTGNNANAVKSAKMAATDALTNKKFDVKDLGSPQKISQIDEVKIQDSGRGSISGSSLSPNVVLGGLTDSTADTMTKVGKKALSGAARGGIVGAIMGMLGIEANTQEDGSYSDAYDAGLSMAQAQIRNHKGIKAALIGEEQQRVNDVADKKGYLTIRYSPEYIFKKRDSNGDMLPHHELLSIAYNSGWINGLMNAKYKIYDIGLSQNYRNQSRSVSRWYSTEIMHIRFRKYEQYRRMPQPDTAGYLP